MDDDKQIRQFNIINDYIDHLCLLFIPFIYKNSIVNIILIFIVIS